MNEQESSHGVPLRVRWALTILVAVAVIVGIVIAVNRAGPEGSTTEAGAEAESNKIADIAISEDQAPRSAGLPAGAPVLKTLEASIAADIRKRIAGKQLTGPLDAISCRAHGKAKAGRDPYACTVRSAGITYPVLAVAEPGAGRLTWCKLDEIPGTHTGPEIPLSPSCKV
jgi:hypothetical protein